MDFKTAIHNFNWYFSIKSIIEQRLIHNEIMTVKLCTALDAKMIQDNAGKQCSTPKTKGKHNCNKRF